MKVYRLRSDVNSYQYFLPAHDEDIGKLNTECQPLLDRWHPPQVYVYEPLHKPGDLYNFYLDTPIFSPRASEVLRSHMEMSGELLPLPYKDQIYTLLNVLVCINCLDEERTQWAVQDGVKLWPQKYVFHPNRFSESYIFKIPETYRAEVLIVDWEDDDEDGFVDALVEHQIVGYQLDYLWSSEETS